MTPALVVLGSLNMDFVVAVETLPAPGETVLGRHFQMIPGGKGANQACAAGRLAIDTPVRMVGRVGQDLFADHLKASLASAGVDVSAVAATRAQPTGVAFIAVDHTGQNSIVVASGANHAFPAADVAGSRRSFRAAGFALFQLETPLETVAAGLKIAREESARTMLDPAPAQPLPAALLTLVDLLTPNESEASLLTGRPPCRVSVADAPGMARALLGLGVKAVVLKLGEQGCFYSDGSMTLHSPGFSVSAVDATGAGDVFNAGLAVALNEGAALDTALRFANAAAAISVTRSGAQASVPSRREVDQFLGGRTS
ncbi:MAG TPA: ribokinase [Bryobacteraceae bacterium]|nr:ribokinase [Bryobacteraceae bacterium]